MSGNFFYALEGPLDSMPNALQMRTANFGGFPDFVRRLGSDPRRILEHHGIDPRAIQDPDSYIDCKYLVDVLEYCSTLFKDPLFGLHLAQQQEPEVYGAVTTLCRAAPTFRDAVASFVNYIPVVHSPMAEMELVEGKEIVELRWGVRKDLGANHQASLQATMLDLKLLRAVGGPSFVPSYVNLAFEVRRKDIGEIESRYGCRFHARTPINVIAFPAALMQQPVASVNRLVYRLLSGYMDRAKAASRKTVVETVEDYVRGALPSGHCSIKRCARKLGTSVRSLQANLGAHQLQFSDILDRKRLELARIYLEHGELSLDEIADRLGYSDQSSFCRAFKRWTGSTPLRYRQRENAPGRAQRFVH